MIVTKVLLGTEIESWEFKDDNNVVHAFRYHRASFDSGMYAGTVLYQLVGGGDEALPRWSSTWHSAQLAEAGDVSSAFGEELTGYIFKFGEDSAQYASEEAYPDIYFPEYKELVFHLVAEGKPEMLLGLYRQNEDIETFTFSPRVCRFIGEGQQETFYV